MSEIILIQMMQSSQRNFMIIDNDQKQYAITYTAIHATTRSKRRGSFLCQTFSSRRGASLRRWVTSWNEARREWQAWKGSWSKSNACWNTPSPGTLCRRLSSYSNSETAFVLLFIVPLVMNHPLTLDTHVAASNLLQKQSMLPSRCGG